MIATIPQSAETQTPTTCATCPHWQSPRTQGIGTCTLLQHLALLPEEYATNSSDRFGANNCSSEWKRSSLPADELTIGDLIWLGGSLQILDEPQYTQRGIEFTALCLDVPGSQTQPVTIHPQQLVQLLGHQPQPEPSVPERQLVAA